VTITHVFFDIGGVLGTNGWDSEQRVRAIEHFGLDPEFEYRHAELAADWEIGRLTLAEYLESAVFFTPRPFTPDEFKAFMMSLSKPHPDTIALARRVAARGDAVLMTLNNEATELNLHRIETFGLRDIFTAFFSSCWLGVRKPSRVIFERALAIAQVAADDALFIDDREQNLVPARALGFETHHYTGAADLERELRERDLL
jgi:putative hydrolase of the HAD superfamily